MGWFLSRISKIQHCFTCGSKPTPLAILNPIESSSAKYKSTELVQKLLKQDVNMHIFPQTINYYSFPTQEFERLLYTGKIRHGGHPILRWCMANVAVKFGINEDVRYIKEDAKKRIDPIQAAVMALAGNLTREDENNDSQYNDLDEAYI